jgi:hypothetical protein
MTHPTENGGSGARDPLYHFTYYIQKHIISKATGAPQSFNYIIN